MTNQQIFIFLGGLVFLTIGILASRHYRWKKPKTYLPIALGLFVIYLSTIGPLSESKKRIHEIIYIDSTKVESITFQPSGLNIYKNLSIFQTDRIVRDRNLIRAVCDGLHKAKTAWAGFLKHPEAVCRVEIRFTDNRVVCFGVRKAGKATCITLSSEGEYGWHYAELDASDFGDLLNKPGL